MWRGTQIRIEADRQRDVAVVQRVDLVEPVRRNVQQLARLENTPENGLEPCETRLPIGHGRRGGEIVTRLDRPGTLELFGILWTHDRIPLAARDLCQEAVPPIMVKRRDVPTLSDPDPGGVGVVSVEQLRDLEVLREDLVRWIGGRDAEIAQAIVALRVAEDVRDEFRERHRSRLIDLLQKRTIARRRDEALDRAVTQARRQILGVPFATCPPLRGNTLDDHRKTAERYRCQPELRRPVLDLSDVHGRCRRKIASGRVHDDAPPRTRTHSGSSAA